VSRKTTTTTVVYSEKDKDGNWSEFSKTVTTVVERDDDGYPYGPLQYTSLKHLALPYLYDGFLRPRSKPRKADEEGHQDG
jgi:hypothetical protein